MFLTRKNDNVLSTKIADEDLKILEKLSKIKKTPIEKLLEKAVDELVEEAFDIAVLYEIEEDKKKSKGKKEKLIPLSQVLKDLNIELAS